jgi:hypothetical protein
MREIASALLEIQEEELWRYAKELHGYEARSFRDYAQEFLGWDGRTIIRIMEAENIFRTLESDHLELPANESQALALSGLSQERRSLVWQRVLETAQAEQTPVTVLKVRDAVTQESEWQAEEEAEAKAAPKRGVQVDMNGEQPAPLISLTERGEEALARIRALCGQPVAEAIEQKRLNLSEAAIIHWGEQDEETVKGLAHYTLQGWSVRKALNYMSRLIDGDTTIDELIQIARERGGRYAVMHTDARFIIEILPS